MKARESRSVNLADVLTGKVDPPPGMTKARALYAMLSIELHRIFTHSFVEYEGDKAKLYLDGEMRAFGRVNEAGILHGGCLVYHPGGKTWILACFENGEPFGEWIELLPNGIPAPGPPLAWILQHEEGSDLPS